MVSRKTIGEPIHLAMTLKFNKLLVLLGFFSLLLYGAMGDISYHFNWGEGYSGRPILSYLAIYFSLFAIYAAAGRVVFKQPQDRSSLWIIFIFGLLFRAILLPANQIQEDDVYRYLWDGKVFAQGINPYEYAPAEVQNYLEFKIQDPAGFDDAYSERNKTELKALNDLKWENRSALTTLERVNHPDVPTIYPPMAQVVFRIAHHIKADSILTIRLGFFIFDLTAFGFIVLLLARLGKNPHLSLIYFWSPLVIKETFNSTHLDIIGIAFLCGSVYFLIADRRAWAILFLACSFLGKLYPIILLPVYLKTMASRDHATGKPFCGMLIGYGLLFFAMVILGYLPFLGEGAAIFEGLRTFSTHWQSNDSIFALLVYFFSEALPSGIAGQTVLSQSIPTLAAKASVVLILSLTLLYLLVRPQSGQDTQENVVRDIFILLALVFLLSPVQNPWYLTWVVPFLCVFPKKAWILLTGLMGFYYLDFYFDYQEIQQYSRWTPWLEYLPFYALLAWEYFNSSHNRRHPMVSPPA